jgi:hypothetical protein
MNSERMLKAPVEDRVYVDSILLLFTSGCFQPKMALLADYTKLFKPSPGRLKPYPGKIIAPDPSFVTKYFSAIIIYLNFDGFPSSFISTSKDKLWSQFFIHMFS